MEASWEKRFLLGYQTTNVDTAVTFDATVKSIVTGKPLLKATNGDDLVIEPNFNIITQRKATGQATRKIGSSGSGEIQVGVGIPAFNPEFDANANNLAVIFWNLFQKGASEAGVAPFVKTYTTYPDAALEMWLSAAQYVSTTVAGKNRVMHGGLINSVGLSGEGGSQSIKVTPQIIGGGTNAFTSSYDASGVPADPDPDIPVLLFKNMKCEIDGLDVVLDSFNLTITNNAFSKPYNSQFIKRHGLGDLQVTGEIVLPKDTGQASLDDNAMLNKLINLTDFTLELFWGNSPATTNGDVALKFNVLATDARESSSEGEVANNIPFENGDDGTNDISITLADNIDRAIP